MKNETIHSDDPERLLKFDALVRSLRDAVRDPAQAVSIHYHSEDDRSVTTVSIGGCAVKRDQAADIEADATIAAAHGVEIGEVESDAGLEVTAHALDIETGSREEPEPEKEEPHEDARPYTARRRNRGNRRV